MANCCGENVKSEREALAAIKSDAIDSGAVIVP
jgi:hypothetical protein